MAKAFDPATLFSTELQRFDRSKQPYPTEEAGLDGVQSGRKSMEMLPTSIRSASSARTDLEHWVSEAFARGLVVTLTRPPNLPALESGEQPVIFYVTKPDQLWRVSAMMAVRDTAHDLGPWTDNTENLVSHLLGYTLAQRKKWIEQQRQRYPGWGATTVYAILDAEQRARVESVGRRCFGEADALVGLTLMWQRYGPRHDALKRLPKGMTLARVATKPAAVAELFGPFPTRPGQLAGLVEHTLTKRSAAKINAAFVSNVQFLTKRGWV